MICYFLDLQPKWIKFYDRLSKEEHEADLDNCHFESLCIGWYMAKDPDSTMLKAWDFYIEMSNKGFG